jgi:hypothetical protein
MTLLESIPTLQPYAVRADRRPAAGVVSAAGRTIRDDNGTFFPLGTSFFVALWMWEHERDRCRRWLKWMADRGIGFSRAWGQVNGASWEDRVIDPHRANYPDIVKGYLDIAYGVHGLRTQITMFAAKDRDPERAADIILKAVEGRHEALQQLEVTNEAQLGDHALVRRLCRRVRSAYPGLAGTTSPPEPFTTEAFDADVANIAYPHLDRGSGDEDWRQVRQGCEIMSVDLVCDDNEPIGPESSVNQMNDPLRLAALRAVGIVSGMPTFVLHTGAGVRSGGAADRARGRKADIWEYGASIENIIAALHAAARVIPAEAPNWRKMKGHWPETRLVADMIWSDDAAHNNHGCVRVYGGYDDRHFVAVVFGVRRYVELTMRYGPWNLSVYDVLTGAVVSHFHAADGMRFRLEGDPNQWGHAPQQAGSSQAYIVVGDR